MQPSHPGKLYAFGLSAGACHLCAANKINLSYTKIPNAQKYSQSELQKRDHELLGIAALAWGLILANLPVEVVDDFAGGLAETGLPSLFSPTIEGGCMSFIIPPSCFGLITATASGFSFEFEGDEWAFPEIPHPPQRFIMLWIMLRMHTHFK